MTAQPARSARSRGSSPISCVLSITFAALLIAGSGSSGAELNIKLLLHASPLRSDAGASSSSFVLHRGQVGSEPAEPDPEGELKYNTASLHPQGSEHLNQFATCSLPHNVTSIVLRCAVDTTATLQGGFQKVFWWTFNPGAYKFFC